MTAYAADPNTGNGGVKTSSEYGNPTTANGLGTEHWFHQQHVGDGANEALGAKADAAVEGGATTGSLVALIKGLQKALGINTDAAVHTGNAYMIPILKSIRDYFRARIPGDATWVNASSGNQANASAAAAIGATSAKTNYVSGIEITFAGATAATNVVATLAGLAGGTISFVCVVPAGANVAGVPIICSFDPPLPASAANTAITLTLPALGAGNTHACVNIHGWKI